MVPGSVFCASRSARSRRARSSARLRSVTSLRKPMARRRGLGRRTTPCVLVDVRAICGTRYLKCASPARQAAHPQQPLDFALLRVNARQPDQASVSGGSKPKYCPCCAPNHCGFQVRVPEHVAGGYYRRLGSNLHSSASSADFLAYQRRAEQRHSRGHYEEHLQIQHRAFRAARSNGRGRTEPCMVSHIKCASRTSGALPRVP